MYLVNYNSSAYNITQQYGMAKSRAAPQNGCFMLSLEKKKIDIL